MTPSPISIGEIATTTGQFITDIIPFILWALGFAIAVFFAQWVIKAFVSFGGNVFGGARRIYKR